MLTQSGLGQQFEFITYLTEANKTKIKTEGFKFIFLVLKNTN